MKKIISLILALAMVLSVSTAVMASNPEVNLTYTAVDDSSFLVNVELKNNPGFAAFVIKLEYDKYAVTPKRVIKSELLDSGSIISNMEDTQADAGKKNTTSAVFYTTEGDVTGDGCIYSVRFVYKDAIPADKQLQDTVISVVEPIDITNFALETVPFKAGTSVTVKTPTTEREPQPGEYDEPVKENNKTEDADKDYSSIVGSLTGKEEASGSVAEVEKVYTAEVKNVADQNKAKYMAMYEDGTFKPDAPATRYEVIEALDNLFEITSEEFAPAFKDVSDKYKLTVQKFVTAKILNGYTDGTFKGDNTITRAEFVKILAVAFDMKLDETATADFTDIAGHWSENYVKTFVSGGYTKGYAEADGTFTFRPEGKVTRAEVVAFVNRIIKAEGEAAEKLPTDLLVDGANHWAYDEIVKVVK
mgnify:CR=1 FL=1